MVKQSRNLYPKITVVTPTYNRADFIEETIKSVLDQDFQDFEYLILDDGSTDNTEEIVKPFLKDKRVKYLKHKNAGEAETINWGWQLAKGEYFIQVNSDDPILPGLFSEMVHTLDNNKACVVAYSDFHIIDEKGKTLKSIHTRKWDFPYLLSIYSCECATPGTCIRKYAFSDWKQIKDSSYKYISDVKMYWDMALIGNFIRIPKYLATWREHSGSISAARIKSIPEIKRWYSEYFNKPEMPKQVKECQQETWRSINRYMTKLTKQQNSLRSVNRASNSKINSHNLINFRNLQINDNDLIGNKFNGHNLHLYLLYKGFQSDQLVWNKQSNDPNTYIIAGDKPERDSVKTMIKSLNYEYGLNGTNNIQTYDILCNELFLKSDIIHYHLLHNDIGDLNVLPLLTRLKPSVWTLHDTWAIGGHCIHHFDCLNWQKHCGDCPHMDTYIPIKRDSSALNYAIKKDAILRSNFHAIVASKWMLGKVRSSPIFDKKPIHLIPFGIDQEIFKPIPKIQARKELGLPEDAMIISFRCDSSQFKGLDTILHTIQNIRSSKKIVLLVLANKLNKKPSNLIVKEYGWINDDPQLAQIYSASDLFLMPSTMEAFGMMAIEAMSCNTLPIVLEGTALPEIVNSPSCGVSVPNNTDTYLETVQFYLEHDSEREKRASKCHQFAKEKYNLTAYLDSIINVYRETMENHSLSEDDRFLLQQIEKHMLIKPTSNLFQRPHRNASTFKTNTLSQVYKITQHIPFSIRIKAKNWLYRNHFYENN